WRFTPELGASFEGQWIGYSASRNAKSRIENSEIESSQADLQSLLDFLDINEGQLVEGILDKESTTKRGWQNSWNAIAGMDYYLPRWRFHLEAGYYAHTTPDAY